MMRKFLSVFLLAAALCSTHAMAQSGPVTVTAHIDLRNGLGFVDSTNKAFYVSSGSVFSLGYTSTNATFCDLMVYVNNVYVASAPNKPTSEISYGEIGPAPGETVRYVARCFNSTNWSETYTVIYGR